ncbi:MAG: energy transducer TonB [Vulcanimicrobiaceae bacterium]
MSRLFTALSIAISRASAAGGGGDGVSGVVPARPALRERILRPRLLRFLATAVVLLGAFIGQIAKAEQVQTQHHNGCKVFYQDAAVVNKVKPNYPDSARDLDLGKVTVLVQVTIGPSGSLVGANLYQSSNNMALDQAALTAARQSSYVPKIVACQPVVGDLLFRAEFDPSP